MAALALRSRFRGTTGRLARDIYRWCLFLEKIVHIGGSGAPSPSVPWDALKARRWWLRLCQWKSAINSAQSERTLKYHSNNGLFMLIEGEILILTCESSLRYKTRNHGQNDCMTSGRSRISQRGCVHPWEWCQPIIWPIFPENCMKMKKFWPRAEGAGTSLAQPQIRHCWLSPTSKE